MDVWPGDEKQAEAGRSPQDAPGRLVPQRLADHEMLRCIGRGSYGQVWLARNIMGVYRALKIVYRKSFDNYKPFERELAGIRKFEPISRLHEGFIDVLHVGNNHAEQYFFYIMELADDQVSGQQIHPEEYSPKTLASEISRRGKLSLRESLDLGLAITEALTELHRHGLVHRDIKPSNIIFVNGRAKLGDIGLVADLKEAHSYVGTEGFIPPEGPGTAQSDLYSFGKVLYEASTGRDRQDFPELPTHWEGSGEYAGLLELNEIILQACKPEPSRRYASAAAMHADLLMVVNGKSVRRLRLLEQRMANLKRIAGLASLIILAAALVGYQVYRGWRDARDARQRQVSRMVGHGNRLVESGNLLASLPDFAEALRLDEGDQSRERTHRLRFGSVFSQCPKLTQMWLAPGSVNRVEFSPDGRWILFAALEHQAEIHEAETGKLYLHAFAINSGLNTACFSPDGKFVVTTSEQGTATIWETRTLRSLFVLRHECLVETAQFSPNGERIVTGCQDGSVRIWNARTGQLEFSWQAHAKSVLSAVFSHDGNLVGTGSMDETAQVWLAANGHPAGPALAHSDRVNGVAFSLDDKLLATCCGDRIARVWKVANGERILPDMRHDDSVQMIQYSPDGRWLLTSVLDGTARLWRADDFQPAIPLPVIGHGERVRCASFSPDMRSIAIGCADGSVRVWDLAGAQVTPVPSVRCFSGAGNRYLMVRTTHFEVCDASNASRILSSGELDGPIESASLCGSGNFFACIMHSRTNSDAASRSVQVRNSDTGTLRGPGIALTNGISAGVLDYDGKRLAAWGENTAQVWDIDSGTLISGPLKHPDNVSWVVFNRRGDRLVSATATNAIVWDARTGRRLCVLPHSSPVVHCEFSPHSDLLVTCCSDMTLNPCFAQVWQADTGKPVGPPLWHRDGVLWASFSPDGQRVVTGGEDFVAIVWDYAHGKQLGQPLTHAHQVSAAVFNSDGAWIGTSSGDHTARVWDAETQDPITPPLQHPWALTNLLFLSRDRAIASGDWHGDSYSWPLRIETRPVNDVVDLARLLASTHETSNLGSNRMHFRRIELLWSRLRNQYPNDFSTATNEILAWHQRQVLDSEKERHWAAAVFHLQKELLLKPEDQTLKDSLERDRALAKARRH